MLEITLPKRELWDEKNERFIDINEQTLRLEHSLVSLSKWESKWCKPFLSSQSKTYEELLDYIQTMTITQNVDPKQYLYIDDNSLLQIKNYIEAPMTATTFSDNDKGKKSREIVTAELIYYWMIALQIPFECQKWHLNKLLTLIKICSIKNEPPKKMSQRELLKRNTALNEARRKKLNTKG